jgi:hypothetical protein
MDHHRAGRRVGFGAWVMVTPVAVHGARRGAVAVEGGCVVAEAWRRLGCMAGARIRIEFFAATGYSLRTELRSELHHPGLARPGAARHPMGPWGVRRLQGTRRDVGASQAGNVASRSIGFPALPEIWLRCTRNVRIDSVPRWRIIYADSFAEGANERLMEDARWNRDEASSKRAFMPRRSS